MIVARLAGLFLVIMSLSPVHAAPDINPELLKERWPAFWIAHPSAPSREFGVFHFRRTFDLAQKPESFVVHVSADNRYRLFVNGVPVSAGPERGDVLRWHYETVDIAGQLQAGKNVLAAVVWNFGEYIPWAQITLRTAFILQGNSEKERQVDTGDAWRVLQNPAYQPYEDYRRVLNTFIVVGPGEQVDGSKYPWGWEEPGFDDSGWSPVRRLDNGIPHGVGTDGAWFLHPRSIPALEESIERIGTLRRAAGIQPAGAAFDGQNSLKIPARTKAGLLVDQKQLTTAYPELRVSGGKGSRITLTYSEALFDQAGGKGNRDEIEGREVVGYSDIFQPDGGPRRLFRPLWFRTYRYIQMDIETAEEPLSVDDFYGMFTAYPFAAQASFKASDASLGRIWDVGWRTARLCANETYYDCPYYEQLQYAGDTRIQALISLYVSGDDRLMRKALQVFDDSRIPEGLTLSRYPCSNVQVIPPYSLFWISMIHDYWMHREDPAFVRSFFPGIQSVLDWHERHLDRSGMLGGTPWWNFVDWPDQWNWDSEKRIGGVPSVDSQGRSSILSLQLVYVLNMAADLARESGRPDRAGHYSALANRIKESTYRLCWDERRSMIADTPDKSAFSQHANALAVLVDAVPKADQQLLMERVSSDRSLVQCTMYYRFYLFRAMKKAGLGERYVDTLGPWRDMLEIGLTTFAERPEPTRSDCHAWSASPNYEFLATVCGVEPATPGFGSVRIAPYLGLLEWVEGTVPHPQGSIRVRLNRKGAAGLEGEVTLPEGIAGEFVWNGKTQPLKPGSQKVSF
jgi:alpha-L-rhamnosidase